MLKFVRNGLDQQMVLAGYAGTGKSSLINVFLDELRKTDFFLKAYCTAHTNEAVRVISNATSTKYEMTIYSLLGLVLIEESGMKPKIMQKGKPKIHEYDIVILDEASMIGDELLVKIYEQLRKHPHLKLIYVGDSAQLPPINTSDSLFDKNPKSRDEQTESSIFKLSNKVELVKVQRVAKDNPIISVVTPIRMNLASKEDCFDRVTKYADGSGVQFYTQTNEFIELMYEDFLSDGYQKNNNYVRAIAYTNNTVNKLNEKIRAKIFNNETPDEFMANEVLIVASPLVMRKNANVKEIALTTGERIKIVDAEKTYDDLLDLYVWKLLAKKYDDSNDVGYELLVVAKESENTYTYLLQEFANEAKRKLAQVSGVSGKQKSVYTAQEAWFDYYSFKEKYCKLKYSYAMTTHTSQGSTIERVYVFERDLNILSWNDVVRNKLKYTAFTRASKLLRILT